MRSLKNSSSIPPEPTEYFSLPEWASLTERLRLVESGLRIEAERCGLRMRGDSRWPGLTLCRRCGIRRKSVSVRLDAESYSAGLIEWNIDVEETANAWILFYRLRRRETVATLTDEQMRDGATCVGAIARAIERHVQ